MSDQDNDEKARPKDRTTKTLVEKVRPIQEQARREGFISDGSAGKPMMDEA